MNKQVQTVRKFPCNQISGVPISSQNRIGIELLENKGPTMWVTLPPLVADTTMFFINLSYVERRFSLNINAVLSQSESSGM
jgi:hypothetical protein